MKLPKFLEFLRNPVIRKRARNRLLKGWFFDGVLVLISAGIFSWIRGLLSDVTPAQVVRGSELIVQLDSFLTAGYVVSFFYYWGTLSKELSHAERFLHREEKSARTEEEFVDARQLQLKVEMLPFDVLVYVLLVVGSFTFSGIMAVSATLTEDASYVTWALAAMVYGVGQMFLSWFSLHLTALTFAEMRK